MHQWSVVWNVLTTYTHPLVHVFTGDMHRMITVEGTSFVMVLSFTAGTAPRSIAGPEAGALDPNLAPEGQDFPQECCCQQICSLCQQTAPPGALLQLLPLALSCSGAAGALLSMPVTASPAVPRAQTFLEGVLEPGQRCRQSLTEVPAGLPVVVSGEPAQAAAGAWIQAPLQALQAEMLQLP